MKHSVYIYIYIYIYLCVCVSHCLYFMISNDLDACGFGLEPHNLSHLNM